MDSKLSRPFIFFVSIGTPRTGKVVKEATMPAKCAAAHLAGMVASLTTLPVLGVPMETKKIKGLDSLLSMAQMPKGVPVGCLAIDGAFNAGILAASIIGNFDTKVKSNLERWRRLQTQSIKKKPK